MEFICYSDWDQLPENANLLFEQGSEVSVFFSRPWLQTLSLSVLHENESLLLACVIDNEQILAILPLIDRNDRHAHPLTHLYSSLFSFLLALDNQQQICDCLASGLANLPVESVLLDPVSGSDKNISLLQQALSSVGFECFEKFRFYNWIHQFQGQSFDSYMAQRPSRLRNTIARKQRKLAREHDYDIRLFTDTDLERAIADYFAIYNASWKAHELFSDFLQRLVHNFAQAGWLRLAILYIDDQPAAAQFWFVVHGKASIFRLAYDEKWKQYSPGSILISYLMQHVIEIDQVDEIDFLTGNDAYKADWMSERRERLRTHCVKPVQKLTAFDRLKRVFTFRST